MTKVKYKADIPFMAKVTMGVVRALQDPESGTLYYDICGECEMLLDENEMGYGHECEYA